MSEIQRIEQPHSELLSRGEVPRLLDQIRPQWRAKNLIERVEKLLPVDPSSACQRLLNASIFDLREKIVIAGVDIASEVAAEYRLPPVTKADDIENYSTHNTITLAYRMGLLSRADWRRITRAYEIRRDLEHEDNEYEAGIEDVIYIFKTCIDSVLSRDPITLIRVPEVKEIIQASGPVVADAELLREYEHAPDSRQLEILKFLLSTALDDAQPDLVRQNANTLMTRISGVTKSSVRVALATHFQSKVGRSPLTEFHIRVAHSAAVLPYLKRNQRQDFFARYADQMDSVGYEWRSHTEHGELLRLFAEFGGLASVPDQLKARYVKWLVLCFCGEPGGYGAGQNRRVFFSNVAAPLIEELLTADAGTVREMLAQLRDDKNVKSALTRSDGVARRYEALVDMVEE